MINYSHTFCAAAWKRRWEEIQHERKEQEERMVVSQRPPFLAGRTPVAVSRAQGKRYRSIRGMGIRKLERFPKSNSSKQVQIHTHRRTDRHGVHTHTHKHTHCLTEGEVLTDALFYFQLHSKTQDPNPSRCYFAVCYTYVSLFMPKLIVGRKRWCARMKEGLL